MTYSDVSRGIFLRRLNRFAAEVLINDDVCTVHVRNTGRCTKVISAGAEVSVQHCNSPARKTAWTLIAVKTEEYGWVNVDSLAPNKIAGEWLAAQGFDVIRPEYHFGGSRIDFYAERGVERYLIEVKGCTLAEGGMGKFPDAPTERGQRHLRELAAAAGQGYRAVAAFVIMLRGVRSVIPNADIDPKFAEEFRRAESAGVVTVFIPCDCTADSVDFI